MSNLYDLDKLLKIIRIKANNQKFVKELRFFVQQWKPTSRKSLVPRPERRGNGGNGNDKKSNSPFRKEPKDPKNKV